MLVLTRREGESLRIGTSVRVTVVALAAGQVRIGVEAPDDIMVYREEVIRRLEAENREAAQSVVSALRASEGAASECDEDLRASDAEQEIE